MSTIRDTYPEEFATIADQWADHARRWADRTPGSHTTYIEHWGAEELRTLGALITAAVPALRGPMTAHHGGPNLDIELADYDDDPEVTFTRVLREQWIGYSARLGEHFFEEDTEDVACDLVDLPRELDETVSLITVNLSALGDVEVAGDLQDA